MRLRPRLPTRLLRRRPLCSPNWACMSTGAEIEALIFSCRLQACQKALGVDAGVLSRCATFVERRTDAVPIGAGFTPFGNGFSIDTAHGDEGGCRRKHRSEPRQHARAHHVRGE